MRFTTRGSDNWSKPSVPQRKCHRPDVFGPLLAMDEEGYCPLFKGWVVAFGVASILIWAIPSGHSAALRAEPAAVIAKGE